MDELLAELDRYSPWVADALGARDAHGLEVLDVGCGPGTQIVRLARRGARVTGVDLVPVHVEQAKANLADAGLEGTVHVADAEHLPFADASFDRVISLNALQFTPDFDRALGELRRMLRPQGDVRLVVYHRGSAYFWWHFVLVRGLLGRELVRARGDMRRVIGRNLPWGDLDGDMIAWAFGRNELRRRMMRAGFSDITLRARGFAPEHFAPVGPLVPGLRGPGVSDRLGRLAGWYLVARARAA